MKILVLTGIFLFASYKIDAQIKGKILVNGKEFKTNSDSIQFFEYKPLSAKITKRGKKILDEFTKFYERYYSSKDSLMIVIDPAETIKEYKIVNNHIAESRSQAVISFLGRNFNVEGLKTTIYQKGLLHSSAIKGTLKKIN